MSFSKFSPAEHIRREKNRKAADAAQLDREASALRVKQDRLIKAMLKEQAQCARLLEQGRRQAAVIAQVAEERAAQKAERLATPHKAKDGSIKIRLRKV